MYLCLRQSSAGFCWKKRYPRLIALTASVIVVAALPNRDSVIVTLRSDVRQPPYGLATRFNFSIYKFLVQRSAIENKGIEISPRVANPCVLYYPLGITLLNILNSL